MKRTARYYKTGSTVPGKSNPGTAKKARAKKQATDKKINQRPEQVKKRMESNDANRKAGTYGNGDGKDWDHAVKRFVDKSTNRGRKGEGARKRKTNKK
jgi:hypothetical protein